MTEEIKNKFKNHTLADKTKKWIFIEFIHKGKETFFYSFVNSLSGVRLSSFGTETPFLGMAEFEVKDIVNKIYEKSEKVIGVCGNYWKKGEDQK